MHAHSWHHNVKFLFAGEWPSDLHTLDTGQHAYFGFESIRANPVEQRAMRNSRANANRCTGVEPSILEG